MNYEEFRNEVLRQLTDFYGKDANVCEWEILGNNEVRQYGIHIQFAEGETGLPPRIGLEELYQQYADGRMEIADCIGKIIDAREQCKSEKDAFCEFLNDLSKWDLAKHKVYPVLLSAEANSTLKKDVVSEKMLDLSIAYIVRKMTYDNNFFSTKVTHSLLKWYGISCEELHRQAVANLKKDGYGFYDVRKILGKGDVVDIVPEQGKLQFGGMYVLKNASGLFGATGMFYRELLLEKIGNMDCFVVPSSVHETIFIPTGGKISHQALNQIVKAVNALALQKEEVLSEHCYYYDGSSGELKMTYAERRDDL